MPGISADLEIDYSAAIAGGQDLGDALSAQFEQVASTFQDQLSTAIEAVAAQTVDVPIQVDDSAVATAEAAVQQLGEPIDVPIEIDDSTVEDAASKLQDLSSSADTATSGTERLTQANTGLEAAAGLAVGEVGGLKAAAGELGPGAAAAAGGVAILGGGLFELFQRGLDATSATERFNLVLGDMKDRVETVQVGDLNTTLDALTKKMGDTKYQTETAAATIYQFSQNAGATKEASAQFTDSLFALAARAVSLNPALGATSDVAARMEIGLGRARSAAQQFGISISQAEINQRAMNDTGATSASQLTAYEKSVAGAEIALERYGGTLSNTIDKGSQNSAIALRRLTAEFNQFLEDVGKPLVPEFLQVFQAAIPIGESFARVLADLGKGALPAVLASLQAVTPLLNGLGFALEHIAPVLPAVTTGLVAFYTASTVLPAVLGLVETGLLNLAVNAPIAGDAILTFGATVETVDTEIEASAGPIGLLVAGIGLAATAVGLFGSSTQSASDQAKGFADQIAKTSDAALLGTFTQQVGEAAVRALAAGDAFSKTGTALATFRNIADQNVGSAQRLVDAMKASGENTDAYQKVLDKAVASQKAHTAAQDATDAATKALTADTAAQASTQQDATTALDRYHFGTLSAADATKALDTAASDLKATMDLLLGDFVSADQAQTTYLTDLQKLGVQLLVSGDNLDVMTQAGRDNHNAIDTLATDAESWSQAIFKSTNNVQAAEKPLQDFRTQVSGIRDDIKAQGGDTTFLDQILNSTDAAIAAMAAKAGPAKDAGAAVSKGGADGAASTFFDWINSGGYAASGLVPGIASQSEPVTAAAGGLLGDAVGAISGGYGAAQAAGASFGGGFAAGIGGALGDVVGAVSSLVDAADTAAHDKLKNPPFPSQMGQDLGQSLGIGFAVGIEDSATRAASAASAVAASAISSLGGAPVSGTASVPVSREVRTYAAAQGQAVAAPVVAGVSGPSHTFKIYGSAADAQAIGKVVRAELQSIEIMAAPVRG